MAFQCSLVSGYDTVKSRVCSLVSGYVVMTPWSLVCVVSWVVMTPWSLVCVVSWLVMTPWSLVGVVSWVVMTPWSLVGVVSWVVMTPPSIPFDTEVQLSGEFWRTYLAPHVSWSWPALFQISSLFISFPRSINLTRPFLDVSLVTKLSEIHWVHFQQIRDVEVSLKACKV